jgi:DNA replication protein DnaC
MKAQQNYGKDAIFEIMRRLEGSIQANGGFYEPAGGQGPEPYSWIPERFRDASFDSFETGGNPDKRKVLTLIREQVMRRNMLWYGNSGTGKTHLTYACVKAFGAKYRNLSRVYEEIKADWEGEPYIIREYAGAPLLILDEIDKTSGSVWERNTLFKIIDGRYNGMKPTTLIANHFDQGIQAFLGEPILDRLRFLTVHFNWESYRGREAAARKDAEEKHVAPEPYTEYGERRRAGKAGERRT